MAKRRTERQMQIEREVKRAIGYGNERKAAEAGAKLYRYLTPDQKARVQSMTESGKDPKKTYGTLLADKLMAKSNKGEISVKDVRSMATRMDMVVDSETRAREIMIRSWRKDNMPNFNDFVKASGMYKNKGPRSIAGISEGFEYAGGTKKEGYIYRKNVNGIVYEVQTPGYDEEEGRLHGFRWRELGSAFWQE